jgi:hypothetical protein
MSDNEIVKKVRMVQGGGQMSPEEPMLTCPFCEAVSPYWDSEEWNPYAKPNKCRKCGAVFTRVLVYIATKSGVKPPSNIELRV